MEIGSPLLAPAATPAPARFEPAAPPGSQREAARVPTGSGSRTGGHEGTPGPSAGPDDDRRRIQQQAVRGTRNDPNQLPPEARTEIQSLKRRDREVRAHEAAHVAAGGGYIRGGTSFSYQTGPDGKRYAVGGEVGIDTSAVPDNPQATIAKMQQVRAAALAPASPSGQDRAVAAQAARAESQARVEAAQQASHGEAGAATAQPARDDGRAVETDAEDDAQSPAAPPVPGARLDTYA